MEIERSVLVTLKQLGLVALVGTMIGAWIGAIGTTIMIRIIYGSVCA